MDAEKTLNRMLICDVMRTIFKILMFSFIEKYVLIKQYEQYLVLKQVSIKNLYHVAGDVKLADWRSCIVLNEAKSIDIGLYLYVNKVTESWVC